MLWWWWRVGGVKYGLVGTEHDSQAWIPIWKYKIFAVKSGLPSHLLHPEMHWCVFCTPSESELVYRGSLRIDRPAVTYGWVFLCAPPWLWGNHILSDVFDPQEPKPLPTLGALKSPCRVFTALLLLLRFREFLYHEYKNSTAPESFPGPLTTATHAQI